MLPTAAMSVTAVACLVLAASTHAAKAGPKPHLVMSVVDDLGWNDVGWHDTFNQIKTPKLDKLVKEESIIMNNYYVYRFCSPTRSTFMSGRYPWHIGQQTRMNLNPMPGIACGINLKYDFLPKVLKKAGYATWALGKWHLGFLTNQFTPTFRGFDHYLGYYSGAEEHFTHLKAGENLNKYDLTNNTGASIQPCMGAVGNASATYSSYLYGNETLRHLAAHDASVPLFIYLAWNNVHSPNEAPDNYLALHPTIQDKDRKALAGMMSAIDDQLTGVIDGFKQKGMWDNTLLVFTTDNGGNLGGSGINYPLRGGKYTFWQGGVRGNSFLAGGLIPPARRGTVWEGAAHCADWYTTFAGMAGVSVDDSGIVPADGVDLWEAVSTNGTSPRSEVVLQIMSNSNENLYTPPSKAFCKSAPQSAPLCDQFTDPSTPRPFPKLAVCNTSDATQQWVVDALFTGSICSLQDATMCFNVAHGRNDQIILFPTSTGHAQANEQFTVTPQGAFKTSDGSDECVRAAITDNGTLWTGPCTQADAASPAGTWSFDAASKMIKFTAGATSGCVQAMPAPGGGGGGDATLQLGVLIQGRHKLISGYPGWKPDWDGWIQPPSDDAADGVGAGEVAQQPSNGSSLCVASPCLYDIFADPTEHNDIAASNPDIVKTMLARVMVLLKGEVTVDASGLCPTPYGSRIDPGCGALAESLGFWEPWRKPINADF